MTHSAQNTQVTTLSSQRIQLKHFGIPVRCWSGRTGKPSPGAHFHRLARLPTHGPEPYELRSMTFLDAMRRSRLLAILRGVQARELPLVAEACNRTGLGWVEITLNTNEALSKIASLRDLSKGNFEVGAGTVLSAHQAREAVAAGARFVIAPVLDLEVARAARDLGVPYIPGALTPHEVWSAYQAGATMVKLFPARCFGPSYVQELRGPFGEIPFLGCGGIRQDNLREYLDAGVDAVALGASVFRRDWLAAGNLTALLDALGTLIAIVHSFEAERATQTGRHCPP